MNKHRFLLTCLLTAVLLCQIKGLSISMKKIRRRIEYKANRALITDDNIENYLALIRKTEGLYTIELALGSNHQKFNVIFDTGSSLLWVSDSQCKKCKAPNLFKSNESTTLIKTEERKTLNYITGEMNGFLCSDQLKLGSNSLQSFSFLLADDMATPIEIDGLIGFQRHYENNSITYSIINSLYDNFSIGKRMFVFDSTKTEPKLFLGEIPSYLDQDRKQAKCSCDNDIKYWNCRSSVKMGTFTSDKKGLLLFDSGTNGIVAPKDMLDSIKEHLFPEAAFQAECSVSLSSFDSISCSNHFVSNVSMKNNLTFIINDIPIDLNVNKLFNENNEFLIYFGAVPQGGWLLGQPYFEQYATLFNNDNNSIVIYLNANKDNRSTKGDQKGDDAIFPKIKSTSKGWIEIAFDVVFWTFGIVLIMGLILITYIWWKRKRIPMEMIGYDASNSHRFMSNDF